MEYNDIKSIAKKLEEIYEEKYLILKNEADYIIKNKITTNEIENCLDNFLDVPTDKAYKLLRKLCKYYNSIDQNGALFYLNEFEDMYDYKRTKKL